MQGKMAIFCSKCSRLVEVPEATLRALEAVSDAHNMHYSSTRGLHPDSSPTHAL